MEYEPPSPDEVRALLKRYKLTGSAAGEIIGVTSRQVRRWTGGASRMPFAALYTMIGELEGWTITQTGWRAEIYPAPALTEVPRHEDADTG